MRNARAERKLIRGSQVRRKSFRSKGIDHRKVYHVVRTGDHWLVKEQNTSRIVGTFATKTKAIEKGRKVAKSKKLGQLIVHKKNNRIQTEFTYGKDPRSSKG